MCECLATMVSSPYYFRSLDRHTGSALLRSAWQQLATASSSWEAIYQGPTFADFLISCAQAHQRFHLYGAYAAASHERLGLIPLLHTGLALAPPARWRQREQLVMLGSSPLLPANTELLDALHAYLFAEFPRVRALVYRALPQTHAIWQLLQRKRTTLAVHLHGWRACHSMQLAASYATLLDQLGGKRRYNLKRQQRQLAAAAGGALTLEVIRTWDRLALLEQGLALCCPPARRRQLWDTQEMLALAQHGLLMCFRIDAGRHCCGVILGLQADRAYHLFNILPAPAWQKLSAGTSILQLALAYLCDQCSGQYQRVEFGYGQPGHHYQSSNTVSLRSHVLLLRDTRANRLLRRGYRARQAVLQALA